MYHTAGGLYKESMELKEKDSTLYLLSLEGYIRSGINEKFLTQKALPGLVNDGLSIATENALEIAYIIINTDDWLKDQVHFEK